MVTLIHLTTDSCITDDTVKLSDYKICLSCITYDTIKHKNIFSLINWHKCNFLATKVSYMRHIITSYPCFFFCQFSHILFSEVFWTRKYQRFWKISILKNSCAKGLRGDDISHGFIFIACNLSFVVTPRACRICSFINLL